LQLFGIIESLIIDSTLVSQPFNYESPE